jgi:hypothetical protein
MQKNSLLCFFLNEKSNREYVFFLVKQSQKLFKCDAMLSFNQVTAETSDDIGCVSEPASEDKMITIQQDN